MHRSWCQCQPEVVLEVVQEGPSCPKAQVVRLVQDKAACTDACFITYSNRRDMHPCKYEVAPAVNRQDSAPARKLYKLIDLVAAGAPSCAGLQCLQVSCADLNPTSS